MQEGVIEGAMKYFCQFCIIRSSKDENSSKNLLPKSRLELNLKEELKYLPSKCKGIIFHSGKQPSYRSLKSIIQER